MTDAEHRFLILISAREESPLWEILISPNTSAPTPHEYKTKAVAALRSLIENGLVEVFGCSRDRAPLLQQAALELISAARSFEQQENSPELGITRNGSRTLQKDCFGLSRERQYDLVIGRD